MSAARRCPAPWLCASSAPGNRNENARVSRSAARIQAARRDRRCSSSMAGGSSNQSRSTAPLPPAPSKSLVYIPRRGRPLSRRCGFARRPAGSRANPPIRRRRPRRRGERRSRDGPEAGAEVTPRVKDRRYPSAESGRRPIRATDPVESRWTGSGAPAAACRGVALPRRAAAVGSPLQGGRPGAAGRRAGRLRYRCADDGRWTARA